MWIQGPGTIDSWKKTRGQKSHATVPLSGIVSIWICQICQTQYASISKLNYSSSLVKTIQFALWFVPNFDNENVTVTIVIYRLCHILHQSHNSFSSLYSQKHSTYCTCYPHSHSLYLHSAKNFVWMSFFRKTIGDF